jgi:hypothetical protein
VVAVTRKLYELALDGDVSAARCWLDHVVGRPVQAVQLSSSAAPKIDPVTMMQVVLEALADLPNFDQIRHLLSEAFRPKEPARDSLPPSASGTRPGALDA